MILEKSQRKRLNDCVYVGILITQKVMVLIFLLNMNFCKAILGVEFRQRFYVLKFQKTAVARNVWINFMSNKRFGAIA